MCQVSSYGEILSVIDFIDQLSRGILYHAILSIFRHPAAGAAPKQRPTPAKLDLILNRLHLRDRVQQEGGHQDTR